MASAIEYTLWKRRFWTFYFFSFLPWPIDLTSVSFPLGTPLPSPSPSPRIWSSGLESIGITASSLLFVCLELCRLASPCTWDMIHHCFPRLFPVQIRLESLIACISVTVIFLRLRLRLHLSLPLPHPPHLLPSPALILISIYPFDPFVSLLFVPFVLFSVWLVLGLVYLRTIALLVILHILLQS